MKTICELYNTFFDKTQITIKYKNEIEIIFSEYCKIPKQELYLNFNKKLDSSTEEQILSAAHRRKSKEPLQYILGYTDFFDCKINVNKSVLIPRPETEYLAEMITKESFNSILDIGTGSGCIAISIKNKLPNVLVDAVDISSDALEMAKENAEQNNVEINFWGSDILENVTRKYDMIVSNPPYIPPHEYEELAKEIIEYEPKNALLANDDGLYFYKEILNRAKDYLTENGIIYFEIGYNLAEGVKKSAFENGFNDVKVFKDLNGFDRIIRVSTR